MAAFPDGASQASLFTARQNIAAQIASMTATPKPSYSVDGKSFSWGEHFNNLLAALESIDESILRSDGAFEVRTAGV
jgi:hypothetical protein